LVLKVLKSSAQWSHGTGESNCFLNFGLSKNFRKVFLTKNFRLFLLFDGKLRFDDLAPNVPILGLPPGIVNYEVLGLDVFISCSWPGCFWASGYLGLKRPNFERNLVAKFKFQASVIFSVENLRR